MPGTGHLDMPGPPAPATPPEPTVNILQMEGPTTDPTCQPWPGPPPQPDIPAPSSRRVTWTGKYKFLLSCVGYCVGLGNIWRFPYLCYRNGGGVFLIPYFIMSLIMGLPLFLMELSLGQYGAAGPITIWNCCPLLKGIGIAMLITSSLVSLYYNVIIAWAFYYLGSSFQSPLPWSCDAPGNAYLCQNASGIVSWVSASEVFWNEQVLGVMHSSGLGDPGAVQWPLALCLLAAWIIVFFCTLKGIHSSGKMVYVTATFPYLVILTLVIWGATLDGSLDGVRFYLSLDWSRLQSAQVWSDAASQIFYSLCIGFGGLVSMASYNEFDNNVIQNTLVITIGNCCTSFFAGFAIFSVLGHMAWRNQVPVGSVTDSGPGLMFVAYPEALSLLPISPLWSVLFFLTLFTLGADTLVIVSSGTPRSLPMPGLGVPGTPHLGHADGMKCTGQEHEGGAGVGWGMHGPMHVGCTQGDGAGMQPHPTGTGHGFLHVPRCHRDGDAHGDSAMQSPLCKDCPQCPVWGRQGLGRVPPPLLTSPVPQFGNIKGITRAILDEFPALDNQRKKAALLGALCTSFYLLGLPLVTQGGIFWFTLIDKYSTGFGLITISLFMCLGITFCYGVNQFCQDIMDMIRQYPPWCKHMLGYFKACWAFFTPCLLLFVLVCTCLDMHHMPLHHGTYEYPTWGTNLGICMGILTCLQVPLWAIMALCRESGTLRNRFQKAIQPLHSWRAAAGRNMDGVVIVWHSPSP